MNLNIVGAPSILLIEDSKADTVLIEKRINNLYPECRIHATPSLGAAYDVYLREKLDLIILDLNLPDGFGYKSAEEALSFIRDIPVIVLTGMGNSVVVDEISKMGIKDVINKTDIMNDNFEKVLRDNIEM